VSRLDRIEVITTKHGASLLEYMVLDLLANVTIRREDVGRHALRLLGGGSYHEGAPHGRNCDAAVENCFAKGWIQERDSVLTLTAEGSAVEKAISAEIQKKSQSKSGQ
jgi:hypothetical protein